MASEMGTLLRLSLVALLTLASPAMAAPKVLWTVYRHEGRTYLQGMVDESEVDNEFWARCRSDGEIDVSMGAESHVGKGRGEPVSLTLSSGGQSVKISGVSRESENAPMTGGIELRTKVKSDNKVFAVLSTGQPIAVTGPVKPMTWEANGLKRRVAEFLKACQK